MPFRQTLDLTNMSSLPPAGTSGTRTIYHPANMRIHSIRLFVQQGQTGALTTPAAATRDQIIAAIAEVRLKLGTITLRTFSAAQLYAMLDTVKENYVTGVLPIYFSDPRAASVLGEEATSWDLHGINTDLQIELVLNMPAAGTYFNVRALSLVDDLSNTIEGKWAGRFVRYERWSDALTAGRSSYFGLRRTRPWSRLWLFPRNATPIKRLILRRNGVDVLNLANTAAEPELASDLASYDAVIPAGNVVFPVLLNVNKQITDQMEITPNDTLELITEMDTGDTVDFIQEVNTNALA
jgi:hypothetical protein